MLLKITINKSRSFQRLKNQKIPAIRQEEYMEKDIFLKRFFSDNERYADLINGIGCNGEQIVCEDDLQELDSNSGIWNTYEKIVKYIKHNYGAKTRDILRKAAFGINFAVIGIENQEEIDYSIPFRIMSYDIGEYEKQAAKIRKKVRKKKRGLKSGEYLYGFEKDSLLNPVITFLLYYGTEEWDGPTDLHGMIDFEDIPKNLRGMTHNYHINLIEIRKLADTSIFQTDIRQVFDVIRYSKDAKRLQELVQTDPYYQEMEEDAFDVIATYTNAEELIQVKELHRNEGGINMCEAITALIEEGKMEGIELGIEQGEARLALLNRKLLADNRIADLQRVLEDTEYRKKLYEEYSI